MADCRACRARTHLIAGAHPCYGGTSSTYWQTRFAIRAGKVWCPHPATHVLKMIVPCRCRRNMDLVPMCAWHAERPTVPDLDLSRYRPDGWPTGLVCAGCGVPVQFTEPVPLQPEPRLDPCRH